LWQWLLLSECCARACVRTACVHAVTTLPALRVSVRVSFDANFANECWWSVKTRGLQVLELCGR
jgi:hypothetical protein